MSSFLAFFLLCILAAPANADDPRYMDCRNNTNYTSGSPFQTNLDELLADLPESAASSYGWFDEGSVGDNLDDRAYGLAQCRADIDKLDCRACLDASVQDLATKCTAGQKTAMLMYDKCLIRHSNESFFYTATDDDMTVVSAIPNPQSVTQPQFMPKLAMLMGDVTAKAAYESPRSFAVGSAEVASFLTIFGMAQCTQDLAPDDCNRCLTTAVADIPSCCNEKAGASVFCRSCFIRFENHLFYNVQDAEAAMGLPGGVPKRGNGRKHRLTTARLAVSITATVTGLVVVLLALCMWRRNKKVHKHAKIGSVSNRRHGDEEDEMGRSESMLYDLATLRAATGNFSEENKLGEGGFGPVYKGVLENGQEIAVKRLSTTSRQGQEEMKNEVVLVAKLQHKNLVRVLGFCIQEHESLLVYEFLSNSSLDQILFDPARRHELSWGQKRKIIEGVGRGLLYLHEDSRLTVIHRDLKASNILLDADMNPKISDFGLAKLFSVDSSAMNTSCIAGTYGYMAPEYALHGSFSTKSDVFSYGVLMLEIITGRRNTQLQGSKEDLLTFVWRCWRCGSAEELLDICLAADGMQPQEVLRCIHIGLLCVQEDPKLRPGMASVILMLNTRSITLPAPTAPALAVVPAGHSIAAVIEALLGSSNLDHREGSSRVAAAANRSSSSINEASVSDLEPR